jgi:hypothetical protein
MLPCRRRRLELWRATSKLRNILKSFIIKNVASYDKNGVQINDLKKVNFIYRANGSGKIINYHFEVVKDDFSIDDCHCGSVGPHFATSGDQCDTVEPCCLIRFHVGAFATCAPIYSSIYNATLISYQPFGEAGKKYSYGT